MCDNFNTQGLPRLPRRLYFGRQVAVGNRRPLTDYALDARAYIGPTSMDAEIAFHMCNQARIRKGDLVMDPYVGASHACVGGC